MFSEYLLRDLIETNIRQRGTIDGFLRKNGVIAKELERIYGITHGGNRSVPKPNNSVLVKTQKDIADEMGISVDTLQNYKKLTEMIPELEDLVDTGIVSNTTALAIVKQLSDEFCLDRLYHWLQTLNIPEDFQFLL